MIYENIREAVFVSRPNRFIANIVIDGRSAVCHVKNTGRCKELLLPGARIFVQEFDNPARKTKYDLISVYKGSALINMDSQAPNKAVGEWIGGSGLFEDIGLIRPETAYKNSRFDFYVEAGNRKVFIEVKGVTLEDGGVAMFPDAPTERGVKHLRELAACADEGYDAYVIFVIQMDGVRYFTTNEETHPAFGEELKRAKLHGVQALAFDCRIEPDSIIMGRKVAVRL